MGKILLASQNQHKGLEFAHLLATWPIELAQPFVCEENAATYLGNALLKARTVQAGQPNSWVLADDSGLEVEALAGRPGIYSARYGGVGLSSGERNNLLLKELSDSKGQQRRARFICCLVLLHPEGHFYAVQAGLEGQIANEPRSQQELAKTFGYDPVFELNQSSHTPFSGQTLAEITPEAKNILSHRGCACRKLQKLIDSLAIKF